jgi:hypothetical protein
VKEGKTEGHEEGRWDRMKGGGIGGRGVRTRRMEVGYEEGERKEGEKEGREETCAPAPLPGAVTAGLAVGEEPT